MRSGESRLCRAREQIPSASASSSMGDVSCDGARHATYGRKNADSSFEVRRLDLAAA